MCIIIQSENEEQFLLSMVHHLDIWDICCNINFFFFFFFKSIKGGKKSNLQIQ